MESELPMKRKLIFLLFIFILGFFSSIVFADELIIENPKIEVGNAQVVNAAIEISFGDITISGGATKLLEGEFRYFSYEWKPSISYQVRNSVGELKVEISTNINFPFFNFKDKNYISLIHLNNFIPMNLFVKVGAGRSQLDLTSMALETLIVESGVGEVNIDLEGNTSISRLNVKTGLGKTTIDLRGSWEKNVDAKISSGVGEVTVLLPQKIGVKIETEKGLGEIDATNLTVNGNIYTNQLYGKTSSTLKIYLEWGIGKVNLY